MNDAQAPTAFRRNSPGLGLALAAFALALLISFLVPAIPTLTACVVLGILFAALPWRDSVRADVKPGLAIAARRLLRIGVVLLGFKLSLVNIAELGWLVLGMIVAIVVVTFFFTWGLGRMLRLPARKTPTRLPRLRLSHCVAPSPSHCSLPCAPSSVSTRQSSACGLARACTTSGRSSLRLKSRERPLSPLLLSSS